MSIRTKTYLICVTLTLLPVGLVGAVAYAKASQALGQSLGVSLERIAQEAIDTADRSLAEVSRNVQTWAAVEGMQEVMTGDVDGRLTTFLGRLHQSYGYFASLDVIDRHGLIVASSVPAWIGTQVRPAPEYFRLALAGTVVIEDVQFDTGSQAWVVIFACPIQAAFEEGQVGGVLTAKWKADELVKMTQRPTRDRINWGQTLKIVRRDGLVLSAPASQQQGIFTQNLMEAKLRSMQLAVKGHQGFVVERDEIGRATITGYAPSTGYRDFRGLGGVALITQDVKAAFAPAERLKTLLVAVAMGTALCVMAAVLVVSNRMTRPIVNMARIAGEVAQGNFSARIGRAAHDELGALARAFDQMTERLEKSVVSRDAPLNEIAARTAVEAARRESNARILEMEKEVNALLQELGRPAKYSS